MSRRIDLAGGQKRRVAVYARVSVGNEETEMSLTSQMKGFQKVIDDDPTMVLAGMYADEGITGTSVRKRKPIVLPTYGITTNSLPKSLPCLQPIVRVYTETTKKNSHRCRYHIDT